MAEEHIMVVDDDPAYLRLISSNLKREGYRVTCARTGEEALAMLESHVPDLMVLETLLPGIDGLEVCRLVRETSILPIIIVSSRGSEADQVDGLLTGADDYIPKPFSVRELLARVGAVLRRARRTDVPPRQAILEVGDLRIDPLQWRVTARGRDVVLSPTEFRLLYLLAASPGVVLTHNYVLQHVWGPSHEGEREILRAALWRLRQKLEEDPSNPRYIITHPGVGYMIARPT